MGKKHKHEEHVNHERWVISFADMMTLLFALFVVLYAIGETKLRKLKDLKQSIAFALNFEGEGKTKTEGLFDRGESGGAIEQAMPLINSQPGPMKQLLLESLPDQFKEKTGKSLEIVITSDSTAFTGPMSAFFEPGRVTLKPDMTQWVGRVVSAATAFQSNIRINLRAPDIQITRNRDNTCSRTSELCHRRNEYMLQYLARQPHINPRKVVTEFQFLVPSAKETWEDDATMTIAFSNH